jgi:hypothetical protein
MQGQTQELSAQLGMYGQMTAAARGFFEEGSSGYRAMNMASQAFAAAQMATNLVQMTQGAILAIVNQGQGDPWSAFARIAAMIALMGAVTGVALGGGGGGAPAQSNSDMLKKFGTGTVLGDDSAKSESLANSLKILEKTNTADLAYSAQMTRSLKNIEVALTGVTSTLLLRVNSFTALAGTGLKQGDGKIKDYGIGWYPQQIGQILAEGFKVMAYTNGSVSMARSVVVPRYCQNNAKR